MGPGGPKGILERLNVSSKKWKKAASRETALSFSTSGAFYAISSVSLRYSSIGNTWQVS